VRPISLADFISAAHVVRPTVVSEDLEAYKIWDIYRVRLGHRIGCKFLYIMILFGFLEKYNLS
ncbi:hypothetical protein NECAME_19252, partial [Necator americanus]